MTPTSYHPYVSQLVRVAPRPAGAGLDFARWCLSSPATADRDDDRAWCVTTPDGRLRLGGRFQRTVPRPRGYRPLRVATGMLHPAGRGARPVAVTLELLPWSSRWSELGLTAGPLRWADSRAGAERAYLRAANAALARLAQSIEAPPSAWLARLVAGQPAPKLEDVPVVGRPPDPHR